MFVQAQPNGRRSSCANFVHLNWHYREHLLLSLHVSECLDYLAVCFVEGKSLLRHQIISILNYRPSKYWKINQLTLEQG